MHTLYHLLKEYVEPYSYLETWALRDKESSKFLVVREVADLIPARYIFKPTISWEIIMLRKPYIASDSKERLIDNF